MKKVVGNRKLSLSTYHMQSSDAANIESGAYNRPRLIASDAWTGKNDDSGQNMEYDYSYDSGKNALR